MKLLLIVLVGLFTALAAALPSPSSFTLENENAGTVFTDGKFLLIGGKPLDNTEILILRSHPDTTVTFTPKGKTPPEAQNLYVIKGNSTLVGLTGPSGRNLPKGAEIKGFGIDTKGLFVHNGVAGFGTLVSAHVPQGVRWNSYPPVNLSVKAQ